jgi:hypothetical protein
MIGRAGGAHEESAGILNFLPWAVGIEIHDVVRVYQADEQAPRLVCLRKRFPFTP